ncbi:D-isomer specific 2-hydroxyacid dehydrogenase [Naematelia encephala]|uniref:D-isomer specific 2-hydroxyacid dehydrogenase n=1 Tax=Naematelia encephala TaxID=71784 RepID=A0A1Y2B8M7_9TREE|nr:D-isomer specific 2-hydroxyacid dehydrogenase [Naematelia encephala]
MSKPKVLVVGTILWAKKELQQLSSIATVISPDFSSREGFLKDVSQNHTDAFALLVTNGSKAGAFDRSVLGSLPKGLKYICCNGAGYDWIDVNAAFERGISVSHTPGAVDHGTATTALYLLLAAYRQFSYAEKNAREGRFLQDFPLAHDPEGKTIGIVGMGGIGKALARRVLPLGMKIIYHNRKPVSPEPDFPAEYKSSLDELLAEADVVSIHIPLNEYTKNSFGSAQFDKMKQGSVLINTARGGVIDQEALIKALESGKLYSAGLDVFPNEPEIDERLRKNDKITILPHVGTHTLESRYGMEMVVINNIRSAINDGQLLNQVPEQKGRK